MARRKRETPAENPTHLANGAARGEAALPDDEREDERDDVGLDATPDEPEIELATEGEADAATEDVPDAPDAIADDQLGHIVEALLFSVAEPLTAQRLAQAAGCSSPRRVKSAVDRLRHEYAASNRAFGVLEIAGGFRLYSKPEFAEYVARLDKVRAPDRLSAAALEALAIVAYRQPIARADIDAVRGVNSSALLKTLMERKLIRAVGRSERPGRPFEYGTTKRFLDHFGLGSVKDLPRVEDLKTP